MIGSRTGRRLATASSFAPSATAAACSWRPFWEETNVRSLLSAIGRAGLPTEHRSSFIAPSCRSTPLSGGAPIRSELAESVKQLLKESDVSFTDFLWSHSGRALYFEGVSRSVRNFWRVDVDPQSLRWTAGPERLNTGAALATDLALAPDGRTLAFTARTESTRLWTLPFDAAAGRVKGAGEPITSAGMDASRPDISLDGKKLAFIAQRAGREELWEKSLKDGHERMLIADDSSRLFPRWSHDGLRLAYARFRPPNSQRAQNEWELMLLSDGSGDEQMITSQLRPSRIAPRVRRPTLNWRHAYTYSSRIECLAGTTPLFTGSCDTESDCKRGRLP